MIRTTLKTQAGLGKKNVFASMPANKTGQKTQLLETEEKTLQYRYCMQNYPFGSVVDLK
jgi:hypothetical protein